MLLAGDQVSELGADTCGFCPPAKETRRATIKTNWNNFMCSPPTEFRVSQSSPSITQSGTAKCASKVNGEYRVGQKRRLRARLSRFRAQCSMTTHESAFPWARTCEGANGLAFYKSSSAKLLLLPVPPTGASEYAPSQPSSSALSAVALFRP